MANFKSFVGGVENVSSSKNMELIYGNMTKLFDAFTQGVLLEQGANSEWLLRTVYRSLSDDFLKIVQDTDAVDKIIQTIQERQDNLQTAIQDSGEQGASQVQSSPLLSETTKKVVTKTLDPNNYDPNQVILDFIDELQTSILQVKINLSREYERQKLAYAKSLDGQKEDLDRLNQDFQEQDESMSSSISEMTEEEKTWKEEHLKKLEALIDTFNAIDSQYSSQNDALKQISIQLDSDKNLQKLLKDSAKKVQYKPKNILEEMKKPYVSPPIKS